MDLEAIACVHSLQYSTVQLLCLPLVNKADQISTCYLYRRSRYRPTSAQEIESVGHSYVG